MQIKICYPVVYKQPSIYFPPIWSSGRWTKIHAEEIIQCSLQTECSYFFQACKLDSELIFSYGGCKCTRYCIRAWQNCEKSKYASWFQEIRQFPDQYQYLGNCPPTPPLTQQQSIVDKLALMLG